MDHFDGQKILTDSQYSFWPKHLCETQLLMTPRDILQSHNDPKISQFDAIILDFAKAFDKISYQRLLAKLEYCGICG